MQNLKQFRETRKLEIELIELQNETLEKIQNVKDKAVKTPKEKVDKQIELEYLKRYLQIVETDLKRAKIETNIIINKVKMSIDAMIQADFSMLQLEKYEEIQKVVKNYNDNTDEQMQVLKAEALKKYGISGDELLRCKEYDIAFNVCFYTLPKLKIEEVK